MRCGIRPVCGYLIVWAMLSTVSSAQEVSLSGQGVLDDSATTSLVGNLTDIVTVQGTYAPECFMPPGAAEGPDGFLYHRPIPDHPVMFSSPDPMSKSYRSFEGWFVRTEYLNWTIQRPGDRLLGDDSPVGRNQQAVTPLDNLGGVGVVDVFTGTNTDGLGRVQSLEPLGLNNANGVRGVMGIPLTFGSFEASVLGFHRRRADFSDTTLLGTLQNPLATTSFTLDGVPTDLYRVYNDRYNVSYDSVVYGAEANLFLEGMGGHWFTMKPIVGFRFMNLEENMTQSGAFSNAVVPFFESSIASSAYNNMYFGQAGMRFEFESQYFGFAFDPKFGLGANQFSNEVTANNFFPGSGLQLTRDRASRMAQVLDLGFTGRIHLTEYFTLTAGYNFLWLGHVSRPGNNIQYNVTTAGGGTPDVKVRTNTTDMTLQGFSIGGEYTFR